jgi:hypothetical protein
VAAPRSDGSIVDGRPSLFIVVAPIKSKPGYFEARLGPTNELLVKSSRQPFLDAARVLIEKCNDPHSMLVMKHLGSDIVALKAPLAKAAKLGVEEGPNGPRFVPFRTGPRTRVAAPPISPTAAAATNLPKNNSFTSASATRQEEDEE